MKIIHDRIKFNFIFFIPNIASNRSRGKDNSNYIVNDVDQLKRCAQLQEIWLKFNETDGQNNRQNGKTEILSCVTEVLDRLNENSLKITFDILVTGSLHLIGATLIALDEERQRNQQRYSLL